MLLLRNEIWKDKLLAVNKMSLLYERKETSKEIKIRYKYWGLYYIALLVSLILIFVLRGKYSFFVFVVFFALAIVFMVGFWKPNREIRKAMKRGAVKVSGSKFSFSNPLTAVIKK